MLLYLVRHGESVDNAVGRIQGQTDSPLSPLGLRQSQALAEAFARLPIDAIVSSPLHRALDSARAIADRLEIAAGVDPRWMEINAGVFQGKTWDEVATECPAEAARWQSHDPDFCCPGGESRRELMERAAAALAAIRESDQRQVVIVAHGGVLAAALKVLLRIPAELNPFSLYNSSISKLAWDDRVKLLTLNQTDHLAGLGASAVEL